MRRLLAAAPVIVAAVVMSACQSSASVGVRCARTADCASPLVCALGGVCRPACRGSGDCDVSSRCLVEPATGIGVCALPQIDDCATAACRAGFTCQGGLCVNACAAIARCPDGVCVDGACMPARDDGGVAYDAGGTVGVDASVDAGPGCHGPSCDPVVAIATGGARTHAVTRSGAVWGWGDGTEGALGTDSAAWTSGLCGMCTVLPVQVVGVDGAPFSGAVEVSAGDAFACARRGDGSVWCWGRGVEGELGDGQATSSVHPVQVLADEGGTPTPIADAVAITSGTQQSCVLRGAARTAWCWGAGSGGRLGTGDETNRVLATRVTGLPAGVPVVSVATVENHTLFLLQDHRLFGVGGNACLYSGVAPSTRLDLTPIVPVVPEATGVASGLYETCIVDVSETIQCWGGVGFWDPPPTGVGTTSCTCSVDPSGGSPGPTSCTVGPRPEPLVLEPGDHIVAIRALGTDAFGVLTAHGQVHVWGATSGSPIRGLLTPIRFAPSVTDVVDVAGVAHVCVLSAPGDVWCWGSSFAGQLGSPAGGPVVWP